MNLNRLFLYFNTVRYLKGKQFAFNFIRRLFNKQSFSDIKEIDCHQLKLMAPIFYENIIDHESVCFLNERRSFGYISSWTCLDEPKLWRYNLHYFDFLLDNGASEQVKDKLINDWIELSYSLKEDAWEPYPVSLRIVNWIKYFISYKENQVPQSWLMSLYQQSRILFGSIEYHLLANHYLKNGKALFFAGAYLDCVDSKKWFNKGKKILLEEISEQTLEDGGHYEKSPMYHSIYAEDCLDIINLIHSNSLDIPVKSHSFLHNNTIKVLDFLSLILLPDGDIPLFNDSAFKIAPHPDKIFKYASHVLGYEKKDDLSGQSITVLDNSGYYIIKDGTSMCVIDCGAVSPEYQPGHTHCDILSYELVIDGHRVVIDTGLHDYESSDERQYCRSTSAHNTIEIDGLDQSELWGQFRVARRAKMLPATLFKELDGSYLFKGGYMPYWSKKEKICHSRHVKYHNKKWTFNDVISGDGEHRSSNFIHLNPEVDCIKIESEYFLIREDNKFASLSFSDNVDVHLDEGWYYPEFGIKLKNTVIRLTYSGRLPSRQEYTIEVL